jgi:hypothetical protein
MTYPIPAVEVSRRLLLIVGIVMSAWLGWLTDLKPYVMVSRVAHQARAKAAESAELPTSGALIGERRVAEQPPTLTVGGPNWEALFAKLERSFADNMPVDGWQHRLTSANLEQARKDNTRRGSMSEQERQDDRESVERIKARSGVDTTFRGSFQRVYFLRNEPPFDSVTAASGEYTLVLNGKPDRQYAAVLMPALELVPFSSANSLPTSFTYPWRTWSLWPAVIGLAAYLLLPYPRRPSNVIAYRRWRIVIGDVVATLLFAMFFVLPLPIVGGSVEAVTTLPLLIPFWGLASLGLWAFYWAAHTAVYCLVMRDGGFDIRTLRGREGFEYADISDIQGALLQPPQWLIALSFVATLFGRSEAARLGQTGRAMMLAGSSVNGMKVTCKDGRSRFIWISDQMGSVAMEHFETFVAALKKACVPIVDTVIQVRAVFPPS